MFTQRAPAGSGMLHAKRPHAACLRLVGHFEPSIHHWSSAGMLHAGKNSMHHASLSLSHPTHPVQFTRMICFPNIFGPFLCSI
jgi:hypothetical protein